MTAAIDTAPVQLLGPSEMDDERRWLELRGTGVGASEVAAVIGVSAYSGPLKVWLEKVGAASTGDNPAMEWGRRLEPAVHAKFADEHPRLDVTYKPGLYADPAARWRVVTPDALADGDDESTLVEYKTGMSYGDPEQWGDPDTDQIPLPYLCQVTWACGIMRRPRWRLATLLLDTRDYREYQGDFDPGLYEQLTARVDAFWHHNVLAGVEPAADGLPETTADLESRYAANDRDAATDLPPEARMWLRSYQINHEAITERQQAKAEAGNLLRQWLAKNSAAVGRLDGEDVVTWRMTNPKPKQVFDEQAFAAAHPGLYEEFLNTHTPNGTPSLRVQGVSW